jgi:DNA replicative helicase MCM subunit Mcm2 (Cdc46/Mcm family)
LYRIAEAYARLDLSDLVTELHAQKAIKLLGRTLDTLGMKSPGQLTESIMKHINKQEFLMTLFKDGITEKSAILKMIVFKHWYPTEESAHWEILQLKNKGFIFENSGKLKLV